MGSVFKARDPVVGRTVALKTIHSAALAGDQAEEYRARFFREARASGVLAHPGIVPVFDVGDHEGAPFLVMEFIEGRTLADQIKKGERFSLERVCEIGQQLAEALGYAHRQGVIHRDIKPANILLTSREVYGIERPRITDFGIAKLASSEITTAGQLLGTPSFMPPEQFTGQPVDGRADLFSLGVILYSLATGEQPFAGETMTAVSYKVVYTEPIPPTKLNPAISPRLEAAILKCLAKNPAERFQTGEDLAQELAAIRRSAAATQGPGVPATPLDADATLGPAQAAAAAAVSPPAVSSSKTATLTDSPAQAGKPKSKPVAVETIFAIILLAVVGVGTAAAGAWFIFEHFLNAAHRAGEKNSAPAQQLAQQPQPVVTIPQPSTTPAATDQTPLAVHKDDSASPNPPPAPAVTTNPASASTASASPAKTGAAPAAPPVAAKPVTAKPKSTPPTSSTSVAPASGSANIAAATPAPPTPPGTAASATSAANTPAAHTAAAAFDPRKLDPNTSTKLKIELSKVPNGLPININMDKKLYLNFITGDKTDLDNLYVPAGVQEFRVSIKSGDQEFDSNVVSNDFKAKKKKTLKIEILQNGKAPAKVTGPLGKDMQVYVSLPSLPFDL
jgi:serine/threonine-protein kinase